MQFLLVLQSEAEVGVTDIKKNTWKCRVGINLKSDRYEANSNRQRWVTPIIIINEI